METMIRFLRFAALVLASALFLNATVFAWGTEYGSRGNRNEGVREFPVSGYTIELLSARAVGVGVESPTTTPESVRMLFYLERAEPTFVVVREVDNKYSYWLDQVKPSAPWRPGFDNMFEWPTADVIGKLPGLKIDDLGLTVRVGSENPSDLEIVAPGFLCLSQCPKTIRSYEFAFKTNATARLEFSIERSDHRHSAQLELEPQILPAWSYGIPVRVTWNAANAEAGEYRLKVAGRVLENNKRFGKEVRFFHQPTVK